MKMSSEWVTLRGGVDLPISAIKLALELHEQGWMFCRRDERLFVGRASRDATEAQQDVTLSDELRESIREHKEYLLVVSDYVEGLHLVGDGATEPPA